MMIRSMYGQIILKHEFTRPDKEQDRINHIRTTGAQTGNVFLAYRSEPGITTLIDKWKKNHQPIYNFTADDGIQHTLWVVDDDGVMESISKQFAEKVAVTYIADGHHRAASAAKVRSILGDTAPTGANIFLTTLFPSDQLHIMDYNRLVKDLNGLSLEELLIKAADKFTIEKVPEAISPAALHQFGLYANKQWYKLTAKENTFTTDPMGILDVTILQDNFLGPLLNIIDQRTDSRIDFVGGIRGLGELEKRVDSGEMALAISLHPVTIQQLFDIADSGNVMPPKSTWFEPKLRDGLLTHLIYDVKNA